MSSNTLAQTRKGFQSTHPLSSKSPVGMSSHATIGESTFMQAHSPSRSPAILPQYLDETMASISSRASDAPASDASSLDESEYLEGPSDWTDNLVNYVKGSTSVSEAEKRVMADPPADGYKPSPSPKPFGAPAVSRAASSMQPQVEECSTPKPPQTAAPASTLQPVLVERTPQPAPPNPLPSQPQASLQSQPQTYLPTPSPSPVSQPLPLFTSVNAEKETLRARLAALESVVAEKDHQLALKDATITTLRSHAEATQAAHQQSLEKLRVQVDEEAERCRVIQREKEDRELVWRGRVEGLLKEVERRGKACLMLWGRLEHPAEADGKGGQKYTYRYAEKGRGRA